MIDAYLQLGDIRGESQDDKHKGWVEVHNVTWGVSQPRATAVSTAGGHTSGKADVHEVVFDKLADIASPVLFQTCAAGKTLSKAKFEFFRADGQGDRVKYYEVELDNVVIGDIAQSVSTAIGMVDQIGMKFSKVKWRYTQQRIAGGAGGNTAGGWDLATNRVA